MKSSIEKILSLATLLLVVASIYFVNNYYLGMLIYVFSIFIIIILILAIIFSGNGMPAVAVLPFAILMYVGNILIDNANKDDGFLVNLEIFYPTVKEKYIIIDTNIKAPNKLK